MGEDTKSAEGQSHRLEQVYEHLAALMRERDVMPEMHTVKQPGEWSAMSVLGHMVEMIPYWLKQIHRVVVSVGDPPRLGRPLDSPDRLEGPKRGEEGYPDKMLEELRAQVHLAVTTFRSMSPSQREKRGLHTTRGEMSVAEMIETFVVGHAEEHLDQIKAILSR